MWTGPLAIASPDTGKLLAELGLFFAQPGHRTDRGNRALGVRRPAPPASRPGTPGPPQSYAARPDPGRRGRVLRARRAGRAVRQLPVSPATLSGHEWGGRRQVGWA